MKMVVFDMAGTTVNEHNLVYRTIAEALNRAGCTTTLDTVLRIGGGKEKRAAIADLLTASGIALNQMLIDKIYTDFNDSLATAYSTASISWMPDALEVFAQLKTAGIAVVLNTGYNEAIAHQLLTRLECVVGQTVDAVITADQVSSGRPAPDMILAAMQRFQLNDPLQVAKVGDTSIDIAEGINAGCGITVGITTGADSRARLNEAGADYVIDRLDELLALVPTL